jgi:hypothetical protein
MFRSLLNTQIRVEDPSCDMRADVQKDGFIEERRPSILQSFPELARVMTTILRALIVCALLVACAGDSSPVRPLIAPLVFPASGQW